jgi:hypothetical protein
MFGFRWGDNWNSIFDLFLITNFKKRCLSDRKNWKSLQPENVAYESHLPSKANLSIYIL